MSIEFKIPHLGENVESADVGQVLVHEGDVLSSGKAVLELETEKAVFEVECPHAGRVSKIHVKPGDTVSVGTLVLTIEESAAAPAASAPASAGPVPAAESKKSEPQPKAAAPAAATNGEARKQPAAPASSSPAPETETAVRPAPAPAAPDRTPGERFPAPAAPATRRLARELGVDLYQVEGRGPGGRITQDDVRKFVKRRMQSLAPAAAGPAAPPLPDFSEFGPVERVKMNKLGQTAAAALSLAWATVPHVTQHDLADVTDLEAARRRFVSDPKNKGPKVTMTVLAVKACVAALKTYPHFNASFDAASGEVVYKHYYNIGIAVDTEYGLLVPVVRDADQKTVLEIAQEVTELAEKARTRKLDLAAMKGGSFTITNLGGIGGTGFTPIVNWPEVAILGMSRSFEQVRLAAGKTENRLMLPLSLSYDHRVVNGADAARFVRKLCELFSDPIHLLVEV